MPVLVDSSLWVHQLRKGGDPAKRDRVNALLESDPVFAALVVRAASAAAYGGAAVRTLDAATA